MKRKQDVEERETKLQVGHRWTDESPRQTGRAVRHLSAVKPAGYCCTVACYLISGCGACVLQNFPSHWEKKKHLTCWECLGERSMARWSFFLARQVFSVAQIWEAWDWPKVLQWHFDPSLSPVWWLGLQWGLLLCLLAKINCSICSHQFFEGNRGDCPLTRGVVSPYPLE